jgi:O-methyltransferase
MLNSLLQRSLARVAARLYRFQPIRSWPKWAGDLLEVKIPSNVERKSERSPAGGSNINIILDFLDRTRDVRGDVAECGVFKGASLAAIALYVRENRLAKRVFGLDSFRGFDESVRKDIALRGAPDAEKRVGGFGVTSLVQVSRKLAGLGLLDSVTLIEGYFSETLDTIRATGFSFVHLDCDIYDSYRQTIAYFYPRMSPGGIILFDEYNDPPWPGCNLAIDEFLADKQEKPVAISMDNYEKYFIQKHPEGEGAP